MLMNFLYSVAYKWNGLMEWNQMDPFSSVTQSVIQNMNDSPQLISIKLISVKNSTKKTVFSEIQTAGKLKVWLDSTMPN